MAANQTKVWVDGCFDLFHYGHANAIRQSRAMADWLVAGCHSDQAISENKGPPVITQSERVKLLKGCRWVDEVIPDAPYTTQVDFIAQHGIHFVAHGDDVTTDANGLDSYRLVKEAGLYRQFPRTPGVSTTDALARILSPESNPSTSVPGPEQGLAINLSVLNAFLNSASSRTPPALKVLNSSAAESSPVHEPTPKSYGHTLALVRALERPTVYLHGTFDLFSSRDLLQLQNACQDGKLDLLVGIWSDDDSKDKLGRKCIWSFQERALGVLQCRYVTGLVLPAIPSTELLKHQSEIPTNTSSATTIIQESKFSPDLSTETIASILERKEEFLARQKRKLSKSIIENQLENQNSANPP
ncbi:hypothetical protein PTTG_03187 [Puccinia triticina 1-1 BBBD Race 1]|uniref:ethanolamine-phosphate cytidylyltransferase n=1 Tax=Puccinia triticina (isolate 1-1 / race 1 (BBBD)) TaxID=630390 RepID=A0A180GZN7_PUCT1|nr:hypothetical protein PTTG_03187 [Puccinia triticina 1-1 BBBD Race 1]